MSTSESDRKVISILENLECGINKLNVKVPPPEVFSSVRYGSIEGFLVIFERYCSSVYGDDQLSWLQVLPSYLDGEPKKIVMAFGLDSNINYKMVRDRLVWELSQTGLQNQFYQDFCDATKSSLESYSCYSIRLEVLIGRVTYLTNDVKRFLVISKFLSCLPDNVLHDVTIHVANDSNVTIMQLVRLVNRICLAEDLIVQDNSDLEFKSEATSINSSIILKNSLKNRCFRCKLMGHHKASCSARIFYCQFCRQHHHRRVECSEVTLLNGNSSRSLQASNVVDTGGNLPLISDIGISKRADTLCKASSMEYQYDATMGIRWEKLSHIPFVDSCSSSIVSGIPGSDAQSTEWIEVATRRNSFHL